MKSATDERVLHGEVTQKSDFFFGTPKGTPVAAR